MPRPVVHRNIPFVAAMLLATASCGGTTDDTGTTSNARTLENCTTNIADDVPEFFRTWFRCVTITKSGGSIVITTTDLPPHQSPYYPDTSANHVAFDTRGGEWHQNPNRLSTQSFSMTVALEPKARGLTITSSMVDRTSGTDGNEYRLGPVGVALDSVEIFNDQAAPGDDIAEEAFTFDRYEAHPAPTGEYHYHSASPGPLEVVKAAGLGAVEVYGIMCDGTLVLGCTELDGSSPPTSGLDAQNGHVHDLVDAKGVTQFAGRYHTHVCPRLFAGHVYTPEIQYYATCNGR